MATALEVLRRVAPNGGWIVSGQSYADITWIDESVKVSEADFEAARSNYDAWLAAETLARSEAKKAILNRIGLTEEEAKLILS